MSKDIEEVEIVAKKLKREKVNVEISKKVYSGCVVHVKDLNGSVVKDSEGNPSKYQIIAVYTKQARVKLVTDYGEEIGMYSIEDIVITDEDPLFKMEDYEIGQPIIWIDYDNVYEGIIYKLHTSMAEIGDIKKLYPTDHRRKIPYYRISSKDNNVLATIKDINPYGEDD